MPLGGIAVRNPALLRVCDPFPRDPVLHTLRAVLFRVAGIAGVSRWCDVPQDLATHSVDMFYK